MQAAGWRRQPAKKYKDIIHDHRTWYKVTPIVWFISFKSSVAYFFCLRREFSIVCKYFTLLSAQMIFFMEIPWFCYLAKLVWVLDRATPIVHRFAFAAEIQICCVSAHLFFQTSFSVQCPAGWAWLSSSLDRENWVWYSSSLFITFALPTSRHFKTFRIIFFSQWCFSAFWHIFQNLACFAFIGYSSVIMF